MIDVLPVIVGIDRFEDITGPFIDSIRHFHPGLPLVVVDNFSKSHYPASADVVMLRTPHRMGYAEAMNYAVRMAPEAWQYVFFNNDCLCEGPFIETVKRLELDVVYGSGENADSMNDVTLQWSAWLVVSRKIWKEIGTFDDALNAGWEDFDYQLRALAHGFSLATADLKIRHLDKHTRMHEPDYLQRWEVCRRYFAEKHPMHRTLLWNH